MQLSRCFFQSVKNHGSIRNASKCWSYLGNWSQGLLLLISEVSELDDDGAIIKLETCNIATLLVGINLDLPWIKNVFTHCTAELQKQHFLMTVLMLCEVTHSTAIFKVSCYLEIETWPIWGHTHRRIEKYLCAVSCMLSKRNQYLLGGCKYR